MSNPASIHRPPALNQKKSEFSMIAPASMQQTSKEVVVPHQEDGSYYGSRRNSEVLYDNEKAASSSSIEEEQIEHVPEGTASPGKALFMLLKAFVGTGVIFLPGSYVNHSIQWMVSSCTNSALDLSRVALYSQSVSWSLSPPFVWWHSKFLLKHNKP